MVTDGNATDEPGGGPGAAGKDGDPGAAPGIAAEPAPADGDSTGTGTGAAANGEVGGPSGPEPTRFGDWERKGRCIDF